MAQPRWLLIVEYWQRAGGNSHNWEMCRPFVPTPISSKKTYTGEVYGRDHVLICCNLKNLYPHHYGRWSKPHGTRCERCCCERTFTKVSTKSSLFTHPLAQSSLTTISRH